MYKILLIGSTPPPIGGVTIHIDRFLNLYNENCKFNISVFDVKKKMLFQNNNKRGGIFLFFFLSRIIHIHISNDYVKLLLLGIMLIMHLLVEVLPEIHFD